MHRREFLAATGLAAVAAATGGSAAALARAGSSPGSQPQPGAPGVASGARKPVVISSTNGQNAIAKAYELLTGEKIVDPAEAIVAGVKLVEDDPNDSSVGYGGLPNEDGVVELDASVMHGPTHKSGAVAAIRNIKNPAAVALLVLRRTNHCLLVGEGALRFAKAEGFVEENLLTEKARQAWLRFKEEFPFHNWLDDERMDRWKSDPADVRRAGDAEKKASLGPSDLLFHYGTVHVSAVDRDGDIASCTSTSGLSWKIPGRVGDSPIIGAGNYCDNQIGAAGATGRGESTITNCAAFAIVCEMERGLTPTEACVKIAKRIVDRTKEKRLLDSKGRPNFGVQLYAVRKDGLHGGAALHAGMSYAVQDGSGVKVVKGGWAIDPD